MSVRKAASQRRKMMAQGIAAEVANTLRPQASKEVELQHIVPRAQQPRSDAESAEIDKLAGDIEVNGLLHPITLRRSPEQDDAYEIVAGERRYHAMRRLGRTTIEAIIRTDVHDVDVERISLSENLARKDLNLLDRARGVLRLLCLELDMPEAEVRALLHQMHYFSKKSREAENNAAEHVLADTAEPSAGASPAAHDVVQRTLERYYGRDATTYLRNDLALLDAPADIQDAIRSGLLDSASKAAEIASVKSAHRRRRLLSQEKDGNLTRAEIRKLKREWADIDAEAPEARKRGRPRTSPYVMSQRHLASLEKRSAELALEAELQRELEQHIQAIRSILDRTTATTETTKGRKTPIK